MTATLQPDRRPAEGRGRLLRPRPRICSEFAAEAAHGKAEQAQARRFRYCAMIGLAITVIDHDNR